MSSRIRLMIVAVVWELLALLLYFKTQGAGFVTDEIGWLLKYKEMGWQGLSSAFGDQSLHYGYHFFGFLLFKIFGLNGTAWMVCFVTLHVIVALLSFVVFGRIFKGANVVSSQQIALAGSLLFLVSPCQTEAVVWYACVHYLVSSGLLLLSFCCLFKYLETNHFVFIAGYYFCFAVSVFTLEISFVFPLMILMFFLLIPAGVLNGFKRLRGISLFVAPSWVIVMVYLAMSKVMLGSAVGHYGADAHLNFSVVLLMGNLSKYFVKLFCFMQFAPFEIKTTLYTFFESPVWGYVLSLAIAGGVLWVAYNLRLLKTNTRLVFMLTSFFVIALLPILNLYFSYVVNIEGDRFSYFASVFFAQLLALFCVVLLKRSGWLVMGGYFCLSVFFLLNTTQSWANSGIVSQSLVEDLSRVKEKKIFLLNVPDNFGGAYLFRSHSGVSAMARTLFFKTGTDIRENAIEVLHFNMNSLQDSVMVEKISDTELKVTFAQWGNWWWTEGIGAADYETPEYKVDIDEWNHAYEITLKHKEPDAAYLYVCGSKLKRVGDF